MPIASIDPTPIRYDLKSLPDGYVEIRRMPFRDWLKRQEMAMRIMVEGNKGQGGQSGMKGEMVMANEVVTTFEFSRCIVSHNLQHPNEELMDFNSPSTLAILDSRVGNEISTYITELHEFDEGNSETGSTSS